MFCHKCGSQNPDNATACGVCGAALDNPYQSPRTPGGAHVPINNWLVPAIFGTLCCCLPFGIVSIVYAAQVNGMLAAGNVDGARHTADKAKMWFWIAFGLGLLVQVGYGALVGISAIADLNAHR
jgi:hypothetical protein